MFFFISKAMLFCCLPSQKTAFTDRRIRCRPPTCLVVFRTSENLCARLQASAASQRSAQKLPNRDWPLIECFPRKRKKNHNILWFFAGAANRIWTGDLVLTKETVNLAQRNNSTFFQTAKTTRYSCFYIIILLPRNICKLLDCVFVCKCLQISRFRPFYSGLER